MRPKVLIGLPLSSSFLSLLQVTGEEEEAVDFAAEATLFEFDDAKAWRERGKGEVREQAPWHRRRPLVDQSRSRVLGVCVQGGAPEGFGATRADRDGPLAAAGPLPLLFCLLFPSTPPSCRSASTWRIQGRRGS